MRRLEKLSISIFFVLLQNHRNAGGHKFVPEKMFSGIKSDCSRALLITGGKYQIAMIISILERKFL